MNEEMFTGSFVFHDPMPFNFEMCMGEICFQFHVKKTLGNRLKYWLFCKFFPFKVSRWD